MLQDKEFKDDSPKSRSELLKDKNIEANDNKYLSLRLQKQFEQNNDIANKAQHISSSKNILKIILILKF